MRFGIKNYEKPSAKEVEGLVCVREILVAAGEIGKFLWNDKGSLVRGKDCSLWRIAPKESEIDAGTFYGVNSHNQPTAKVSCLRADKVNVQWG